MGRKHHSKKHITMKYTKEESKEILNDNRLKDILNEVIENSHSDVHNHKDSNDLIKRTKHHKRHKKHKKEKFIEDCNCEKEEYYCENDSPEDHSVKCKENDSSEDSYDKSVDYHSSENHYDKCKEDDSSEDHYDKSVDYDSSEDHFPPKVDDNCIEIYSDEHDKCQKHSKNDIDNDDIIKYCKSSVTSKTLSICPNAPQTPSTICRPVVIKVPVILSEPKVTISIASSVKLEDPALEIKRIKKNVYLTQCKLIPNSGDGDPDVGIIFISGFIRKNIEYTTKNCSSKNALCGNIKHTTVKVPFDCTTRITFFTRPIFIDGNPQNEVEIFENFIRTCDPCEESIVGRNTCEQILKFTEIFNEEIFCELVNVEIVECDILENPIKIKCQTPINHVFRNITEKVVMDLTIKILQNQQIRIP